MFCCCHVGVILQAVWLQPLRAVHRLYVQHIACGQTNHVAQSYYLAFLGFECRAFHDSETNYFRNYFELLETQTASSIERLSGDDKYLPGLQLRLLETEFLHCLKGAQDVQNRCRKVQVNPMEQTSNVLFLNLKHFSTSSSQCKTFWCYQLWGLIQLPDMFWMRECIMAIK